MATKRAWRAGGKSPSPQPGVHALIANHIVLNGAVTQRSFKSKSRLLQCPTGRDVIGIGLRKHPPQIERLKRPRGHCRNRLCRNPPSPIVAAQPVTELRRQAMHVVLPLEPNATDAALIHDDGKGGERIPSADKIDESPGVG